MFKYQYNVGFTLSLIVAVMSSTKKQKSDDQSERRSLRQTGLFETASKNGGPLLEGTNNHVRRPLSVAGPVESPLTCHRRGTVSAT